MSDTPIVVKDDKPTVIYKYTQKEPASVIDGVAARDLTEFDLAAMSPSQRIRLQLIAAEDGGAYKKVGTVPKGLTFEPQPVPAVESTETEPAATSGKKG